MATLDQGLRDIERLQPKTHSNYVPLGRESQVALPDGSNDFAI